MLSTPAPARPGSGDGTGAADTAGPVAGAAPIADIIRVNSPGPGPAGAMTVASACAGADRLTASR